MKNLQSRLEKLEARAGIGKPICHSVRFVSKPEDARKAETVEGSGKVVSLWGDGPDAWRIYVAPGQSEDDALRAVGIDPDKDTVLYWGRS